MPRRRLGTEATRRFYDGTGWQRRDGVLVDTALFTASAPGPIQQAMVKRRKQAIGALIGEPGRMVECGCGGTPGVFLAERTRSITAVDFSSAGLAEAAIALKATGVPFETVEADMTALPFPDGEFDAAYSAHAIYHIDSAEGQAAALSEIMRIVRPGGRAVFVLANPFPLLFPGRLMRRVLAITPVIGPLLNRMRARPPLPYLPMPLYWLRRELRRWGTVELRCHSLSSVWFDRTVSEETRLGKWAWQLLNWIEANHPYTAARLGCFVTILVERPPAAG